LWENGIGGQSSDIQLGSEALPRAAAQEQSLPDGASREDVLLGLCAVKLRYTENKLGVRSIVVTYSSREGEMFASPFYERI